MLGMDDEEDYLSDAPLDAVCWICGTHNERMWFRGGARGQDLLVEYPCDAYQIAIGVDFYATALEVMNVEVWECTDGPIYDHCPEGIKGEHEWKMLFQPVFRSIPQEYRRDLARELHEQAHEWAPWWTEDYLYELRQDYAVNYGHGTVPEMDRNFLRDRIEKCLVVGWMAKAICEEDRPPRVSGKSVAPDGSEV